MISESLDLGDFVETIRGKDYREIMYLAEQEATDAERLFYRKRTSDDFEDKTVSSYARVLKDFLFFMRYGVRPAGLTEEDFQLFRSVCKDVERRSPFRNRSIFY